MWRKIVMTVSGARHILIAAVVFTVISMILLNYKDLNSERDKNHDVLCETEEFILLDTYGSVSKEKPIGANKIFFFETSGRPTLTPRQSCAIESAARESGLDEVIVLLNSPHVRLGGLGNEAICGLVRSALPTKISFHSLDLMHDFEDTPMELFHKRGSFAGSKFPSTHLSDAIRAAYVYKYGGWYADLDYVIISSLHGGLPDNTIPTTGGENQKFLHLTNSVFKFSESRHPFLAFYLEEMTKIFQGVKRAELGPTFMTTCLRKFCNYTERFNLDNAKGNNSCVRIEMVGSQYFSPVRPGTDKKYLFREKPVKSFDEWTKLFNGSRGVHFYSSGSNKFEVTGDKTKEAYAYLGAKHCPFSYFRPAKFTGSYVS